MRYFCGSCISPIKFVIGLIGYQSNFIQFGLNQLLDAPSHYLGFYVHYTMWAFSFPPAIILTGETFISCASLRKGLIMIFLVIHCWCNTYTYYHTSNKLVEASLVLCSAWIHQPLQNCKVLQFARKNRYPLRHSAFTYTLIMQLPHKLILLKRDIVYGRPFTTEQVENVKTL